MRHALRRMGFVALAGGLTAVLVGPFLIPVPPLKGTFSRQSLADEDSEFIDINNVNIHFKRKGNGKPVFLLLHGFAASLYSWQMVIDALSKFGTVIAYDRPGFGLSEHPLRWMDENPYSDRAQVDLVDGLLDHFGAEQAILIGSSAGGTVAMKFALAHPERVSALILVDAAVYVGSHMPVWLQPLLTTPQMNHLGPLVARQIRRFGPDLIGKAWHEPSRIPPEMLELYQKPYLVENWDKALWEFTQARQANDLPERLNEITKPVLVVTGEDDRIVATRDSIRLASELPNATLEVIAEAGHLPHEEQPEVFMQAVVKFLAKLNV